MLDMEKISRMSLIEFFKYLRKLSIEEKQNNKDILTFILGYKIGEKQAIQETQLLREKYLNFRVAFNDLEEEMDNYNII